MGHAKVLFRKPRTPDRTRNLQYARTNVRQLEESPQSNTHLYGESNQEQNNYPESYYRLTDIVGKYLTKAFHLNVAVAEVAQ